jgi:hypothetical protein
VRREPAHIIALFGGEPIAMFCAKAATTKIVERRKQANIFMSGEEMGKRTMVLVTFLFLVGIPRSQGGHGTVEKVKNGGDLRPLLDHVLPN